MLRLILPACLMVSGAAAASVPASAPTQPSAPQSAAEPRAEAPKKVCTNVEVPGSNMSRRVCRTVKAKSEGGKSGAATAPSRPN